MRKEYVGALALTVLTTAALAQTASEATPLGSNGDPRMNEQYSDENNQSNALSRPRNSMDSDNMNMPRRTMNSSKAPAGTSSKTMSPPANSIPNTTQSVAPRAAPQGSDMPQMAKPKPRNTGESGNDSP